MSNASVTYLQRMLGHHAPTTLAYQLAKAKLDALQGATTNAAGVLHDLLQQIAVVPEEPSYVFQYLAHIAVLTGQLDLASRLINQRLKSGGWLNLLLTERRSGSLSAIPWEARDSFRSYLLIHRDVLDPDRFDFIINRLVYSLPLLQAHANLYPHQPGTTCLNLGDEGIAPGLAFCSNRSDVRLIPDTVFVSTLGYRDLKSRMLQSNVAWPERQPKAIWRGATTGRPENRDIGWRSLPRIRLCALASAHNDIIDAGITDVVQITDVDAQEIHDSGLMKDRMSETEFGKYKYQIDIDGNSNAWQGLVQKLLTGSPVLKICSPHGYKQWYYDRLIPWVNYIPISAQMDDLLDALAWLKTNDREAERIGEQGRAFALSLDYEREVTMAAATIAAEFGSGEERNS